MKSWKNYLQLTLFAATVSAAVSTPAHAGLLKKWRCTYTLSGEGGLAEYTGFGMARNDGLARRKADRRALSKCKRTDNPDLDPQFCRLKSCRKSG